MKYYRLFFTLFSFFCFLHASDSYEQWLERHSAREGSTVFISPRDLLMPERYDLLAKYIYAYLHDLGAHTQWGHEIYSAHLKVWNNHFEAFPRKYGIQVFTESFHNLLDSMRTCGFDKYSPSIPVRVDNHMILNGGHRIAALLLYDPDTPIPCKTILAMRGLPEYATADYFRNKTTFVNEGLDEKYLDAMTLQYVILKKNTYAICLFPGARNHDEKIKAIIERHAKIVYIKDTVLKKHGPHNFIRMIYDGESWTQVPAYLLNKVQGCFSQKKSVWPLRVFIVQTNKPEELLDCKSAIRALCGIGKNSVHINDTYDETMRISQTVLNENSMHFINNAEQNKLHHFDTYFARYRAWFAGNNIDHNCFCIDSSAVMAAYGLRDCKDLDFLHFGHEDQLPRLHAIDSHNSWAHHYRVHKDEIIFNPRYHFYYKGCKFASLEVVRDMKIKRGELKDRHDVSLIKSMDHSLE